MAKRRTSKHHGTLKHWEADWLRGENKDTDYVFLFSLTHNFIKRELWDKAGDEENFFWQEGMYYPAPIGEEEDVEYWRDKLLYEKFCRERS